MARLVHSSCTQNVFELNKGGNMLNLDIERIGELAIVECNGRIVRSEPPSGCAEPSPLSERHESLCLISLE
jgi:hypothetical protein